MIFIARILDGRTWDEFPDAPSGGPLMYLSPFGCRRTPAPATEARLRAMARQVLAAPEFLEELDPDPDLEPACRVNLFHAARDGLAPGCFGRLRALLLTLPTEGTCTH